MPNSPMKLVNIAVGQPCHDSVGVVVRFETRHRDTGERAEIMNQEAISLGTDGRVRYDQALHLIHRVIRGAWTHECDEQILVDGQRVFDPHEETAPTWKFKTL